MSNSIILLDELNILLLHPYLLHISQRDGLRLVASVGPALARVPPGAGHPGRRLSQPVEQCHLLCQAEGAEVGLLLTVTLGFSLHGAHRLGHTGLLCLLHQPRLPCLLVGSGALL